jgi:hypothetical protein
MVMDITGADDNDEVDRNVAAPITMNSSLPTMLSTSTISTTTKLS